MDPLNEVQRDQHGTLSVEGGPLELTAERVEPTDLDLRQMAVEHAVTLLTGTNFAGFVDPAAQVAKIVKETSEEIYQFFKAWQPNTPLAKMAQVGEPVHAPVSIRLRERVIPARDPFGA